MDSFSSRSCSASIGWRTALAAACTLVAGCTDKGLTPSAPIDDPRAALASTAQTTGTTPLTILPRFEIDLDVEGSLKPGHPIHLTVRGQSNFATRDATIQLLLPEVAAAERSSWDLVELPVGEEIAAHAELRKSFAAGERFHERTTITIPEPGYYNVLAIALQRSDDRETDGATLVGRGASRALWLWIDEHGGRVTTEFDPTIFAEGIRPVRGPHGSDRKPPRLRHGGGRYITCTLIPGDQLVVMSACPGTGGVEVGPETGPNATAAVNVTYVDQGPKVTRPLAEAWLSWKVVNILTSAVVATGGAYTNASGDGPTIDCKGSMTDRRLELTVHTENRKVEVKNYLTSTSSRTTVGQYYAACGGTIAIKANDEQAHLFTNMNKNWDGHTRVFGTTPPTVLRAGLYPISSLGTRYDWGAVEVHIEPKFDNVFLEFGVLAAAHEWGHLWQDQFLFQYPASNGLKRLNPVCPDQHFLWLTTTFGCAFGEAFADWYAVLIRESDLPTWRQDLEGNTNHLLRCISACGSDGSIVQGAVGAFLWDITDAAFVENFDRVQKRPIDVIQSIKACEVSVNRVEFIPYTGLDHLIWCMENRFPYEVRIQTASGEQLMTFFNARPRSAWAMAARGPMVDAFNDDFRRLWLVNLYSKVSAIGQTPIFRVIEPSEDPTLQQPPAEPADTATCTRTGSGIVCPFI